MKWDAGGENSYRWGAEGAMDVALVENKSVRSTRGSVGEGGYGL